MKRIFKGKVEKCKVILYDQRGYDLLVASLNGKDIEITLGKYSKSRSNNQNSYLWGVLYKLISDNTGMSSNEVHDAMRLKFLLDREGKIPTLRSTKSLNTTEFEEYCSAIRMFCSEFLDFYAPEPNEISGY